ncbi:MAG: hypothetical protein JSS07_04595 [Proteobacteria bacterium]|nr:hypothetical protein [Pseudomonadota bacterium]
MNTPRTLFFSSQLHGALNFPVKFLAGVKKVRPLASHSINIDAACSSYSMMTAQIIWFGIGLTLVADTAETIFHCPHLLAVAFSAMLMMASAWFSMRALLALCAVTLPGLLALMYFSWALAPSGTEVLALWTQMLSVKSLEYTSGFFIMMGSCIRPLSATKAHSRISLATVLAGLGFLVGNGLVIMSSMKTSMAADSQLDFASSLAEQGSTILGLCLLGFSARATSLKRMSQLGTYLSSITKLPVRGVLLMVGALSAVFTDWYCQYLAGWFYYASILLPPLALVLMSKFLFRQAAQGEV